MFIARFRIEDRSMEPTLKSGDYVLVNRLSYVFSKPSVGDIIVFKESNKFLIKRIKKANSEKILVEGDNKKSSRKLAIQKNSVIGKVFFTIRS